MKIAITKLFGQNKFLYNIFCFFSNLLLKIIRIFLFGKDTTGPVAIIVLHRLGDTVFTIPALKIIISNFDSDVLIVCYPESKSILQLAFKDVRYLELEHSMFYFNDRIATHQSRNKFRSFHPRIIFDLTGVMTSASLLFNSKASTIYGMTRRHFKGIYTQSVETNINLHCRDIYLEAIKPYFKIETDDNSIHSKPDINGKILIAPFAGWEAKEWGLMNFISLTEKLLFSFDCYFITEKNKLTEDLKSHLISSKIKLIETTTIDDLIAEIAKASILIGNDSGPVHIASLLGLATFTIYGPTNPLFSSPSGSFHTYIQKKIKCSPPKEKQYCFTNAGRNGCSSFECMNQLTVDEVYLSVMKFLNEIANEGK